MNAIECIVVVATHLIIWYVGFWMGKQVAQEEF